MKTGGGPRVGTFAAIFTVACSLLALLYYSERLADNVGWNTTVNVEQESRLSASIFRIVAGRDLISSKTGRRGELFLNTPPCEALTLKEPDDMLPGVDKTVASAKDRENALRLFCNSPQGEEIRNEIDAWNATFDLLAVRDNRFQTPTCQSSRKDLSAEIFVPRDCKPNSWRIERLMQNGPVPNDPVPAAWIPGAEPPYQEFGMIADPDQRYAFAGDWAMMKPGLVESDRRQQFRLSDEITVPATGQVTIDIAGRMRAIRISTADDTATTGSWTFQPDKPETEGVTLGPARVAVFLQCGEATEIETSTGQDLDDSYDSEDEQEDQECTKEPTYDARTPIAYQITLRIDRSSGPNAPPTKPTDKRLRIEIDAEPVQTLPVSLRRDRSKPRSDGGKQDKFEVRLTRHIVATCAQDFRRRDRGSCDLLWKRVPGLIPPEAREFELALKDEPNAKLIDRKTGVISNQAFEMGLAPVIGLGPQDWGSLAYALAHHRKPGAEKNAAALELTIDRRTQNLAYQAVTIAGKGTGCPAAKPDKKGRGQKNRPSNCLQLRPDQTATLVVLNADQEPGAIKAAASWPGFPTHLHVWDLEALEAQGLGPAALGWRLVVPDQRPGSTFKAVTGMAAIQLATGDPGQASDGTQNSLSQLLLGKMEFEEQARFLRLASATWNQNRCAIVDKSPKRPQDANTIPVPDADRPRWCARNFRPSKGSLTPYWQAKPPSMTDCDKDPFQPPKKESRQSAKEQFGLCEALMVSSNLFFGGLSEQIFRGSTRLPQQPLLLDEMAQRLSFPDQPCLDRSGQPRTDKDGRPMFCGFDLLRGNFGAYAEKLMAHAMRFDLVSNARASSDKQGLIRTGWGDGASATALSVASVYASLGRRALVRPSLKVLERNDRGCPKHPEKDECADLLPDRKADQAFTRLLAGLHAVGAVNGGSAYQALNDLKLGSRLFVKTGTATYRARNERTGKVSTYFSLWLAGWIEGARDTPIPERLAFACNITRGINNDTGGRTCAKLVHDFLENLNKRT
jgi:cell division protein FtsI/penicillin-binding protein 2